MSDGMQLALFIGALAVSDLVVLWWCMRADKERSSET